MKKSQDKARQKLVDSMRTTKARSETGRKPASSGAEPARKAASRKKTSSRSATAKASSRAGDSAAPAAVAGDAYQSSGRVWPD